VCVCVCVGVCVCVMRVITKWEQFSQVILIIFSDSRDGFNVGILK